MHLSEHPLSVSTHQPRQVAVIGAGIAGLAAAHRLHELNPSLSIQLFEASLRPGGALQTRHHDGFLIERGADNFITNVPWALNLCRRLEIDDQLITTRPQHRGAYVVRQGRLRRIPAGFQMVAPRRLRSVLTSPLLSVAGRLRLVCEPLIPARTDTADETVAEFAQRRLGKEAYRWLVEPLVAGIYTADAQHLSALASIPQFVAMERTHGSLWRGARQAAACPGQDPTSGGARYALFQTFRNGLSVLVDSLVSRLPTGTLLVNTPVTALTQNQQRWQVKVASGELSPQGFDGIVVALSAVDAGRLLHPVDDILADELISIRYASSVVVTLGFRRNQIAKNLDAFGIVVPAAEKRTTLAVSFSSVKYEQRAPDDCELLRVFLGGARHEEVHELPDSHLRKLALDELQSFIGIQGSPQICEITRWSHAMPQYQLGHVERIATIEQRITQLPHLQLAGNAYHGVGIPHCIRSGELAAERLLESLP